MLQHKRKINVCILQIIVNLITKILNVGGQLKDTKD